VHILKILEKKPPESGYNEYEALNDFARESFRYTADQDYIAARMSYKAGLIEPFLWSSLHAIEKYLKAILLFNKISTKNYSHNIEKLLCKVKHIGNINLRLPKNVESFIRYLNEYGENRYFDDYALLEKYALYNLDETVWYIRRYCFDRTLYENPNFTEIEPEKQEEEPRKCRISSGFLERVINEKLESYSYLTDDNFFYGDVEEVIDKDAIKAKQRKIKFIEPLRHFWDDALSETERAKINKALNKYIQLSPSLKTPVCTQCCKVMKLCPKCGEKIKQEKKFCVCSKKGEKICDCKD